MEELKELAKGDDRILFTGFVQGAMLDELYSNAYIYTLPSDLEGMPLSLLEAMSYGNCCLVSDIPECAEVVEDKALIFKKSDVEDLREKLQEACDHPEMVMKMKNQAADFICAKYNWDEVVKKTMKVFLYRVCQEMLGRFGNDFWTSFIFRVQIDLSTGFVSEGTISQAASAAGQSVRLHGP